MIEVYDFEGYRYSRDVDLLVYPDGSRERSTNRGDRAWDRAIAAAAQVRRMNPHAADYAAARKNAAAMLLRWSHSQVRWT